MAHSDSIFKFSLDDEAYIASLKKQFDEALPYRHIAIDNFLNESIANEICDSFPGKELLTRHYKGLNEQKSEGANFELFHPVFNQLREALNSKAFTLFLEKITGIKDIIVSDDSLGSGLHLGADGSFLDVHVDFNIHYTKNIHRRLNLLIYMNKNWEPEFGGAIELWNKDVSRCEKSYLPLFNRCVIFETSDISYHGYSKINIPKDMYRKSFYSYYYTALQSDLKYHDTVFKARPEEGIVKKVKTDVKETIKNIVKRTLKKAGIKV